jgi:hypothetical protein
MVADTYTDTQNIKTVQTLINKLDKLKKEGASPLERIRVIQEDGGRIIDDPHISLAEAFMFDRNHRSERQKKLCDISERVKHLTALWNVGPFADDIEQAGSKLLKYLNEFVGRAERAENKKEIEELASLWKTAPDVSGHFGCVPVTPERTKREALARKQEELDSARKKLADEIAATRAEYEKSKPPIKVEMPSEDEVNKAPIKTESEELSKQLWELTDEQEKAAVRVHKEALAEMGKEARQSNWEELQEEVTNTIETLPPVESIKVDEGDTQGQEAFKAAKKIQDRILDLDEHGAPRLLTKPMKVIKHESAEPRKQLLFKVSDPRPKPNREEVPFEGDALTGMAWGMALTQVMGEDYKFDLSAKNSIDGCIGITMVFRSTLSKVKKSSPLSRARLNMWEPEEGKFKLTMFIQSDKWGHHEIKERALSGAELKAVHADPRKWLEKNLSLSQK